MSKESAWFPATPEETAREIGETFLRSLRMRQPELLLPFLPEGVIWSLPGTGSISGEAIGPQAVVERVQAIGRVGMQLELKHLLVGLHGVALSLHNTASHRGKLFDMHLVTVLTIHQRMIVCMDTFMENVAMVNDFFSTDEQ